MAGTAYLQHLLLRPMGGGAIDVLLENGNRVRDPFLQGHASSADSASTPHEFGTPGFRYVGSLAKSQNILTVLRNDAKYDFG